MVVEITDIIECTTQQESHYLKSLAVLGVTGFEAIIICWALIENFLLTMNILVKIVIRSMDVFKYFPVRVVLGCFLMCKASFGNQKCGPLNYGPLGTPLKLPLLGIHYKFLKE